MSTTNYVGKTREELLVLIKNGNITEFDQLKHSLHTMKSNSKFIPNSIKIGDIHKINVLSGHYAVVISIKNNLYYSLLLTSEENTNGIIEKCKSRFLDVIEIYITCTLIISTKEQILDNFYGIYDNNKQLYHCKKYLKQIIDKI